MTDLAPLTALGAGTGEQATFGVLTLTERPDIALGSVALRRGTPHPAPFGLTLPAPGHWTGGAKVAAFWTGPGQWMIELDGLACEDILPTLAEETPGCSITEQTDGWTRFDITSADGPAPLVALLEKLVNLDPARLAPGRATRTTLHHQSVFVLRRNATALSVWGMRSLAGSLWHALTVAAQRLDMPVPTQNEAQTRRDSGHH